MSTQQPMTPDANPGALVAAGVDRFLHLAGSWLAWDGRPSLDESGERIYTPHKAIRRHTDHLIDHLAEIEALLAGVGTEPDRWHGSLVTLDSDWASFTEVDLSETGQRGYAAWPEPTRCAWPRSAPTSGISRETRTGPCGT